MSKFYKKVSAVSILIISLIISLPACTGIPAIESPEATQAILITQLVTQIVYTATPEPTGTPLPTATDTPLPTSTPTFDPYSVPVYYPLKDCVASRLRVGQQAMVSPGGGPNGIRYGQDLYYDTIIDYAQPGTIIDIVGGPWCSHGWIVWLVELGNGVVGYTPEGNGDEYWLLPIK